MAEPERLGDILLRLIPNGGHLREILDDADDDDGDDGGPPPTCPLCGDRGFVYPRLPEEHPDHGRAVACRCRQKAMEVSRPDRLRRYSNLGPLTRMTFDRLDLSERRVLPALRTSMRNAVQACQSFAEAPSGWIVLLGGAGTGKTHLAAATVNGCIENGFPAYFMSVPDLLDHLRASFAPDSTVTFDALFEQVRTAPVLALDDLGVQAGTPWAQEKLYQLLNARALAELPTVITLGAGLEQQDERIRRRLSDEGIAAQYRLDAQRGAAAVYEEAWALPGIRRMTFESIKARGGPDGDHQRTFDEAYRAAWEFAQHPQGWLTLGGLAGAGKTHLAAAIGHHVRRAGVPALFAVVADLLDHLRAAYDPSSPAGYDEVFEQVRRAPLLVLDDLGAAAPTAWSQEKLFQLLNFRYNALLPTVITYHLDTEKAIDRRLMSRIADRSISKHFRLILPEYNAAPDAAERRSVAPPAPPRSPRGGGRRTPEQGTMV
ncbi:MAG: ATP-binding protein [Chloroflexi bacterium]|nr:ATP-binding protein [Chloroflexota bacterium]